MNKICAVCKQNFDVTEQDLELYKKLEAPVSEICPYEHHKCKMAFRNERNLYKRTCGLCGKQVISMYSPDSPYTIYCNPCWWSDKWNALDFGQDFDSALPFFEQFDKFSKRVPKYSLDNFDHENSDYCNFSCHNKNCYMIFGSWFNEKCMYGNTVLDSLEVTDSLYANKCKYSCELIDCENCYEMFFGQNCSACSQSYFLFDCKNCSNCAFCFNLRGKQLHLFNKQVEKNEFEKQIKHIFSSSENLQNGFSKYKNLIKNSAIHKFMAGEQNENCSGNLLFRCKNTNDVFYALEVENITHSIRTSKHQKDSMFINGCSGGELMYDSIHSDFCYNGKFNYAGEHNNNYMYCMNCYHCENCFACIGLQHKKYCIFNKQYSGEDYEKLKSKILEHMRRTGEFGRFFPMKISPFAYNETIAQEYYPMDKTQAENLGLKWLEEKESGHKETASSNFEKCINCGKNFIIISQELDFYKKYSLPAPKECFACRHMGRLSMRPPYRMFQRNCSNCGKNLKTSISETYGAKLYCEKCYLEAVY